MTYQELIHELIQRVPDTLVNLSIARKPARVPSQASSAFTTNREQGDWAENILIAAINATCRHHVAVRYGKSDDPVAGEEGFAAFYQEFQDELTAIGKRPDLLIFKRGDVPEAWGTDISRRPRAELDAVVPLALAGLEVRSSAFLSVKYDEVMMKKAQRCTETILRLKAEILRDYTALLDTAARRKYKEVLDSITTDTLGDVNLLKDINFTKPSWRSSNELVKASRLFGEIKESLIELKKRKILSITPKTEDLKVVYQWTQYYNVPHFYVQVLFDRIHALSYEHILRLLANPRNNGIYFHLGKEVKTDKKTIKINVNQGIELASRVDMPSHESRHRQFSSGRLLYYVAFTGGAAHLNADALATVLGLAPAQL